MRVCLFEDRQVGNLEPLALTRPVFDLICGCDSLAMKQSRFFRATDVGALVRSHLTEVCRAIQPAIHWNDPSWLRTERTILVNGRWLPPAESPGADQESHVGMIGEEVAYAVVDAEQLAVCLPSTLDDFLKSLGRTYPLRQAGGRMLHYLWDAIQLNSEAIRADYHHLASSHPVKAPAGIALVGSPQHLAVAPSEPEGSTSLTFSAARKRDCSWVPGP